MLQLLSIILEIVIVVVCVRMVLVRRKWQGLGWALTFSIYVFYDLAHHYQLNVSAETLQALFFIATVSALLCIMHLYYRNG
jgi:hypothetical protein